MKTDNIKMPITAGEKEVKREAEKRAKIKNASYFRILKKSLDARDKNNIKYIYSVEIGEKEEIETFKPKLQSAEKPVKVIIAGFGPAGFSARYTSRERVSIPLF